MAEAARQLIHHALAIAVGRGEIAGANLLVVREGEKLCFDEVGMRSVERNEPMPRDTIFRLYSQTKPITGTAAMILLERRLIDLAERSAISCRVSRILAFPLSGLVS